MRLLLIVAAMLCINGVAWAQDSGSRGVRPDTKEPATTVPETKGQLQPQGWTGPIDTKSGGAPAESPQGQSPPGMQPAPEGSSKKIVEPDKK